MHSCMHAILFCIWPFLTGCAVGSLGCLRSTCAARLASCDHGSRSPWRAALDGLGDLSLGTALIGHDGSPLAWSSNALAACRSAWCSMALAACHSAQRLTASAACWSASVDGYGRACDSATRSAASQKLAAWLCLPLHLAFDGYGTACRSLALTASAACCLAWHLMASAVAARHGAQLPRRLAVRLRARLLWQLPLSMA